MTKNRTLGGARLLSTVVLLAVLVLCLIFGWTTRGPLAHVASRAAADAQGGPVDLLPSQTAQSLAALAVTAEETDYAREAQRLADHEVDQAFATALREAGLKRRNLTGEALALSRKVAELQQTVKDDQARLPSADDPDLANAQLGLDTDQLADAQQDLARATGDDRAKIQQELTAHQAAMKEYEARVAKSNPAAIVSARRFGTLYGRVVAWFDQRTRHQLLQDAMHRAQGGASELMAEHNSMEGQLSASSPGAATGNTTDKSAKLALMKAGSMRHQMLGIYDDRIQTEQQLAAVYSKWSAQVRVQHRTVLHLILQSVGLIASILICVILLDALVRNLVDRPAKKQSTMEQSRMRTLQTIFELGIQVIGVLLILFIVFGAPSQITTLLGLATAGLTVVLQDFIIAFFGWFVLMGKTGIRVGDRVEIDGVAGEVLEVGLFRTAMLETGNWTDKGHPTGRRITFINSFAIRGKFFNFSTTGQWMWDEIKVTIPTAPDAYETIERIHKAVVKETEKDAALAQEEWKRTTRLGLNQLSTEPSVDLRPAASGIDVSVRYVTRAADRLEVRNRLYASVIDLLHKVETPQ